MGARKSEVSSQTKARPVTDNESLCQRHWLRFAHDLGCEIGRQIGLSQVQKTAQSPHDSTEPSEQAETR